MSDPIVPALTPTPSHAFDQPDPPPGHCRACRQYHGSVGEGRLCLEREIDRLRAELRRLRGLFEGP